MNLAVTVFLAAALALPAAPPTARLKLGREAPRTGPKAPRDGPAGALGLPGALGALDKLDKNRIASDIELFAACFRAGLPATSAAAAVADSYGDTSGTDPLADKWRRVVAYGALGSEPERAWAVMDGVPGCEELAALVTLSQSSGSAVASGCDRIAAALRASAADEATAAAERAGVLISIPLAAFFLPAFFVLGLAPVVIGLGSEMFGG